jgi:predicted alpha/beta hydrolase family esterase
MSREQNRYKREGTVFFVALIFLMLLNFIMYSALRNASYMVSLVKERENSEKTYYLAYSLYCFVIAHYRDQLKTELNVKTMIFIGPWPSKESTYKGLAWIEYKDNKRTLFIQLDKNNKKLTVLSFLI